MRARASKDLSQLADPELFDAVSIGLSLVLKNTTRLWDGALVLHEKGLHHPARILALIAEEEAAKYSILIDALRCPRLPNERFATQLGRFNDHLAKGLYAKAGWMRPSNLAELQRYVNLHRDEFYLDGPTGADWIFRNEIAAEREGALYVDYFENDGEHHWSDPTQFEDLLTLLPKPAGLHLAKNLSDVGAGTPAALAVVAQFWRDNPPSADTPWREVRRANHQTLVLLEQKGLLVEQTEDHYSWLINNWQFPMYDLDLSLIRIPIAELEERRRNTAPDW